MSCSQQAMRPQLVVIHNVLPLENSLPAAKGQEPGDIGGCSGVECDRKFVIDGRVQDVVIDGTFIV